METGHKDVAFRTVTSERGMGAVGPLKFGAHMVDVIYRSQPWAVIRNQS